LAAYAILIRERMRDAEAFKLYSELARAARPDAGMTPLVAYGAVETLEGASADGVVVLRFDDMAAAKAWYHSPQYSAARQVRHQSADYRVILVEGVA